MTNKTKIRKILQKLGFEDNQVGILLYLYDVKKATILHIARDLGLPRTNVYTYIAELKKINLVGEIYEEGQKFIIPESVGNLHSFIANKKAAAKKAVAFLEQEYKKTKQEAKIHYTHGSEGFKKFAEKILSAKEKPIKAFLDIPSLSKLASKRYLLNFNERRARKRLPVWAIVSEKSQEFLESYTTVAGNEKNKQWFKVIPDLGDFDVNLVVFDQEVVMFAPKQEGFSLHFQSPGFARTMNDMFDYMWKEGKWIK